MGQILHIARRELSSFFASPIAYIVLLVFLTASMVAFFLFGQFFARGVASVRFLLEWMPILLLFLAPAVTMRLFAEERRTGTFEVLMTLPVTEWQVVLGKFLGGLGMIAIALLFTLPAPNSVSFLVAEGYSFDWGVVIGGYLGALLLGATYTSLGLFASALSRDQIVGFLVGLVLCGSITLVRFMANVLPEGLAEVATWSSAWFHFENIARGVIDSRDIAYYFSAILGGLALTTAAVRQAQR